MNDHHLVRQKFDEAQNPTSVYYHLHKILIRKDEFVKERYSFSIGLTIVNNKKNKTLRIRNLLIIITKLEYIQRSFSIAK